MVMNNVILLDYLPCEIVRHTEILSARQRKHSSGQKSQIQKKKRKCNDNFGLKFVVAKAVNVLHV